MKSLRNTTASPVEIVDTGITIDSLATYVVVPVDFPLWAASVDIDVYIDNGVLIVNDGFDDLKPEAAKKHIHEEGIARDASYHATSIVQNTSNSTFTLTAVSRLLMIYTGTVAGQIVKLPVATTLNNGFRFEVWNTSNQSILINNNSDTTLFSVSASQKTSATLQDNSTSNGIWLFEANFLGGTGGGNGCLNFGYNGTANQNRWYEVISNNPTNPNTGTPFVVAGVKAIRAMSISVDSTSTSTLTLFKNGIALDTISLSNAKKNTKLNLNHLLLDQDELSVQLTSGTQSRPNFTLWL
jgi:hypothetical protein